MTGIKPFGFHEECPKCGEWSYTNDRDDVFELRWEDGETNNIRSPDGMYPQQMRITCKRCRGQFYEFTKDDPRSQPLREHPGKRPNAITAQEYNANILGVLRSYCLLPTLSDTQKAEKSETDWFFNLFVIFAILAAAAMVFGFVSWACQR